MVTRNAWSVGVLSCLLFACGDTDSNTEQSASAAAAPGSTTSRAGSVTPESAVTRAAPGTPTGAAPAQAADALAAPSDVAAPPSDAETTASGLASRRLEVGDGVRHPSATDRVRVDYTGWQTDGERFDSSIPRGAPSEFALNGVIAGWTEGLQLMVEGEKRRFWIPEELAYRGRRAPYGMLVFDVELIAILTP
jgi:FKBP-type peptidyl-prolyl cis-trans isomerase